MTIKTIKVDFGDSEKSSEDELPNESMSQKLKEVIDKEYEDSFPSLVSQLYFNKN